MRLRTLFRLFLLLAAVAPITTAKADSLIIGTDTLRLDLHWLDDTPLDELARNDRVFEKKIPGTYSSAYRIYEGENETYIEASVENSSSILYDKEIRNKPRTRRTKRNV